MKFNEGKATGDDHLDMSQLYSLISFNNVNSFINNWVNNGYSPAGGDSKELQLDALHLAVQDMNAYSTPGNFNRYIVLITDNTFHQNDYDPATGSGSQFTKAQLIQELTQSGCKVYISLWKDAFENDYLGLNANDGEFDPCGDATSPMDEKYPLAELSARILASLTSN